MKTVSVACPVNLQLVFEVWWRSRVIFHGVSYGSLSVFCLSLFENDQSEQTDGIDVLPDLVRQITDSTLKLNAYLDKQETKNKHHVASR